MKIQSLQSWPVPAAIIFSAAMLCGTGLFIYQDFKPDFDKYQQGQLKSAQDELEVLQSQNETLKQQASAIIYFESKQIAEDEQKKLRGSKIFSPPDHSAEIAAALNGIWDELYEANRLQSFGQLDSSIHNQQSLDELRKIREDQEHQRMEDMIFRNNVTETK